MDSLTSMKNKLEPLRIYSLESGSRVCCELSACAKEIDRLFAEMDEILRECYIPTATDYGLAQRELLVGNPREELSIEKRRQMLIDREQNLDGGCSVSAFEKILSSYGLSNFSITENFAEEETVIDISDSLTEEMQEMITKQINADFPAHLTITINFA